MRAFIVVAIGLLMTAPAVAQSGGDYDLSWHTIDGGGVMFATGGEFELAGTIGQHDASPAVCVGGDFELTGGFWVPFGPTCTAFAPFDFDQDCDVDLADAQAFANCANGPVVLRDPAATCAPADIDTDGDIDQDDFAAFQRCFNGSNRAADPDCAP
jgi:hypothetical protein